MRYFKPEEFKMGSECVYDKQDKDSLYKLDELRHIVKFALIVNSCYRSPEYNASIGGAKNSMHVQGKAFDLSTKHLTAEQKYVLIETAIKLGFNGIGIYPTFIHVDTREKKSLWVGE